MDASRCDECYYFKEDNQGRLYCALADMLLTELKECPEVSDYEDDFTMF
jgi:hypothetical protein